MRGTRWVGMAVALLWTGCAGGQTGDEGGGGILDCFRETAAQDLPDTASLGMEFAGTYRVPMHWVDKDTYFEGYHDPSPASATELTVEVTRREGPAQGSEGCPGSAWVPIQLEVRSADERLNANRAAWLVLSPTVPEGSALLFHSLEDEFIKLGGGYVLSARIEAGELHGHVVGGRQYGFLRATCDGYLWQLPLSERPSGLGFADVPLPADLLDAIDGYRFDVSWDGGYRAELVARVRYRSETACWRGPDFLRATMGGEVELSDENGVRVAAAPVTINLMTCRDAASPCLEFVVSGGGLVRTVGEDESLPELGFDDGGAWVSQDALGIVSFEELTGGAAAAGDDWYFGSYTISIRSEDGLVSTPRLEVMLNRGSEGSELFGISAP